MDKLKQELNEFINQYGLQDPRTVSKSQELDILIVKEMKTERWESL
ncbi:MAG: aspartyl-phosphate phosphatase Spo0E family protein [Clostridiaceae bacterium]